METKSYYQAVLLDEALPSFFYQTDGSGNVLNTRGSFGTFTKVDVTTLFDAYSNFTLSPGEQFLETNVMPFEHLRSTTDLTVQSLLFSSQSAMETLVLNCGYFGELPTVFADNVGNVLQNMLITSAYGWASQSPSGASSTLYDLIERSRDLGLDNYNTYLPFAHLAQKGGNPELIPGLLADVGTTTLGSWKSEYPLIWLLFTVKPIIDSIKADRFGILGSSPPAILTIYEKYMCNSYYCPDALAGMILMTPPGGFLFPYTGLHFGKHADYQSTSQIQDALFTFLHDDALNSVMLNDLSYYTGYYGCWPPMFTWTYDIVNQYWDIGETYTYYCVSNPYMYC